MSMNLNELFQAATELNKSINEFMKKTEYRKDYDINTYQYEEDETSILLKNSMHTIMDQLDSASTMIDYLRRPIVEEGKLNKKTNGRYALPSGREMTCGNCVEVLIDNGDYSSPYWSKDRIEAQNGVYYFFMNDKIPLDGQLIRVRY